MARRRGSPFVRKWSAAPDRAAPIEPAAALTRAGLAAYTWCLACDEILWSARAADVLGVASLDLLARGDGFTETVEPGSGAGPVETAHASEHADTGCGVPYRARYALRTRFDRLVMVEDLGRWYADAQGRPAVLRGVLRAEPESGTNELSFNLKARTTFLAEIFDDVLEAQRCRRVVTLIVGQLGQDDQDPDAASAAVSERIRPAMRRGDRFIRYAPDRFALVLSSCPAAQAAQAVRRFSALIGDARIRLGAASAPDHALDAPRLLRRAEDAMVTGAAGLSGCRFARAAAGGCGTSPDQIVDALNGRRLVAAYRPAHDSRSGKPVFATLVPHLLGPDGPVPVGDLDHAAAKGGLATLVDMRLVELAAEHLATHPAARIVLGVSPFSLGGSEWLHGLAAHLGARPGTESRLFVAVHEATLHEGATRGRLDALKALGVGIMLGGFGTGHASLRELSSHPIDILRIDGALVQTLPRSPGDRTLVRGLVDLAQHLGIATLAEWADDEAGARLLVDWGVDYVEGPLAGGAARSLACPSRAHRSEAA